jgi:hypothetical protein
MQNFAPGGIAEVDFLAFFFRLANRFGVKSRIV